MAAFAEHAKRVWSVDFSATDPQRFLSGSDDGTVRLWSINEQVWSQTPHLAALSLSRRVSTAFRFAVGDFALGDCIGSMRRWSINQQVRPNLRVEKGSQKVTVMLEKRSQ